MVFTLTQAVASTALTLLVGVPAAYLFAFRRFPGRKLLRAALTVPFVMPPLVVAIALQSLWGSHGFLAADGRSLLGSVGPTGAIILAHVVYDTSLVVRIVGTQLERIPAATLEAAATLGAGRRQRALRILLPLATPAILAAGLLVFLFTITSFGIILLLGNGVRGTLETLVYEEVASFRPHYDVAATLGLLQLAATGLILAGYALLQARNSATYGPRTLRQDPRLGALGGAYLGLVAFGVLAPFIALALGAFRYGGDWSLAPWRLTYGDGPALGSYTVTQALRGSFAFATATALIGVLLALAAHYAFRGASRAAAWWHGLLLLPLGTSSVLLGLGFLLVYDGSPGWDLRTRALRILIAHVLVAFPFVARVLQPAADAIPDRFHEAARSLGARWHEALTRVDLPLLRPSLVAAAVYAFAISLGEFGATLTLRQPQTTTLPLALYDAFGRPGAAFQAQAQVVAVTLALAAFLVFWSLEHARIPRGGLV